MQGLKVSKHEQLEIALGELNIDPDAQRSVNSHRAKRLAEDWHDVWAGAITVGRDPHDHKLYVCDGATRLYAAKMIEGKATIVGIVFDGVDKQERARMFLHLNRDRTTVGKYDLYRVALTAGEPDETDVQAILDERGLQAGSGSKEQTIGSVGTLMSVYRKYGPEILRRTLDSILHSWTAEGGDKWDSGLMAGIARSLSLNAANLEEDRFVSTLRQRTPGSWKALLVARATGGGGTGSRPKVAATMFAERYNSGLKSPKRKIKG